MNILNLLTKEKNIVGVKISDLNIRIAYFHPKKKFGKKINQNADEILEDDLVFIDEPIPGGVISGGVVIDKDTLSKILRNLWKKEKLAKSYAIVSIPEDKIYSHIFPFPKTVDQSHLRQAIDLVIDFQLPFKREDVYISWENINESSSGSEILVSAIPKNIADGYNNALENAGVNMLALESHIASIARSIKLNSGESTLLVKRNMESITIFILKDGIFKFSRTIPIAFIKDEDYLKNEILKIKNSFESENKETLNELSLEESTIKDEYLKYLEVTGNTNKQPKWLVCLGAAIRGKIPKGQDNQISLLSIGTNEAYKYQKTKIFITLIRNMIIGVSIFFIFAFFGSYFLTSALSQTINNTITSISIRPVSPEIAQQETLIKEINSLAIVAASSLSDTINWSILIDEIKSRVINGVIISSFSAPSVNDTISITGVSKDRNTLNQFKKSLQDSNYLTTVELPITNLEQKSDIPFSISFHLRDSSMLYYK